MRFPIRDRAVLIPVELVGSFLPMLEPAWPDGCWAAGGWHWPPWFPFLPGTYSSRCLLPWLPFREFSLKGFVLGFMVMLPFALEKFQSSPDRSALFFVSLAALMLVFPAVTAFVSLNFTGSTPYTSKSGVRLEMNRFIPAWPGCLASDLCFHYQYGYLIYGSCLME